MITGDYRDGGFKIMFEEYSKLDCQRKFVICVFLLISTFFASVFVRGQNLSEEPFLELNKPIERKLTSRSDVQSYRVKLSANQYAKILIEQTETDIAVRLFDANGTRLVNYNNENRLKADETVEIVAEKEAIYRIRIQSAPNGGAGNYKISLAEIRDAGARDRAIFESQKLAETAIDSKLAGKYDEALQKASRALEILEKETDGDSLPVARALNELADIQIEKGNYNEALASLNRAYPLNKAALGADHPQTLRTALSLAVCHHKIREYAKAEKAFREMLNIYEQNADKDIYGFAALLVSYGALLNDLRDIVQAESLLLRAVEAIGKQPVPDQSLSGRALMSLGVVYFIRKDYEKAGEYFDKALKVFEQSGETNSLTYSGALINRSLIYTQFRDYKNALRFYERSFEVREKLFGKDHPENAILLNNIGTVYKSLGDYDKAMDYFERARSISERNFSPVHRSMMLILANIAKIYAVRGDVPNAVAYQKLWDERFEKTVAMEMLIGSERQKLAYSESFPPRTARTITLHTQIAPNNQEAIDLGALVVLQRKGRVLDAVAQNLTALRQRATNEDRTLLDSLGKIEEQLAKLTLNKPPKLTLDEYQKQLTVLEAQKERIEREISSRNAEFSIQTPTVTLKDIKAEIPPDAALIEFATYRPYDSKAENTDEGYGEPRYVVYILKKSGEIQAQDLGDLKTINNTIDDFRKVLRDPERKDVRQFARVVDEKILTPIRAALGGTKHLLISPDGDLNLIPFESLIDEKGKYLIENHTVSYLTSGRDLLRLKSPRSSKSVMSVIANPLFSENVDADSSSMKKSITATRNISGTYFAPLAGTLAEANSIKSLFPDALIFSEEKATEAALKQISAPRILHIATHGFFLENLDELNRAETPKTDSPPELINPLLRSGIALTGANKRAGGANNDGILTALEASGLNLWGTKLVVLSACDTGLGEVRNGEGVYGLRRAFVLAGTETLMMSLWQVSDVVTRELMTNYYKNLKNGSGRGASLRQAQLEMLKNPNRRHPFYWASFIQSGEWANLDGIR